MTEQSAPSKRPLTLGVLLFNYNLGETVGRAIDAIASQARPADEFVVVDGRSTDRSLEVIAERQGRYPLLRLVNQTGPKGVARALEMGLEVLQSDYLYMACSDDYVLPDFFELTMAAAAEHPEAGIVMGRIEARTPDGALLTELKASAWSQTTCVPPERFLRDYLMRESPMHSLSAATLFQRRAFDEIGGMPVEMVRSWCDTLALRAMALKYGAVYVPDAAVVWTVRPGSISQDGFARQEDMLGQIRRAAGLMRSPQLAGRFPEEYVTQWEQECVRSYRFYSSPPIRAALGAYTALARVPVLGGVVRAVGERVRRLPAATGRRRRPE